MLDSISCLSAWPRLMKLLNAFNSLSDDIVRDIVSCMDARSISSWSMTSKSWNDHQVVRCALNEQQQSSRLFKRWNRRTKRLKDVMMFFEAKRLACDTSIQTEEWMRQKLRQNTFPIALSTIDLPYESSSSLMQCLLDIGKIVDNEWCLSLYKDMIRHHVGYSNDAGRQSIEQYLLTGEASNCHETALFKNEFIEDSVPFEALLFQLERVLKFRDPLAYRSIIVDYCFDMIWMTDEEEFMSEISCKL